MTLKSDIYAVGVMAYQLLTGMLPFTADSHEGLIFEKLNQDAVPMDARRQDIPPPLCFAVHRAMHRDQVFPLRQLAGFLRRLGDRLATGAPTRGDQFRQRTFQCAARPAVFSRFTDIELWETVGIGHWQKREPGETQMVRSATVTAISAMTMAEIEGVSLRQASASLQARFSNAFLRLMVNRLRDADERFIASVGLHA